MSFIGENGMFQLGESRLLIALDAAHPNDSPERYSIGGDYQFLGTLSLRGGYVFNTDEEGMTLGAGLRIPVGGSIFTFDYAYAEFGLLGYVQHFTLSAAF